MLFIRQLQFVKLVQVKFMLLSGLLMLCIFVGQSLAQNAAGRWNIYQLEPACFRFYQTASLDKLLSEEIYKDNDGWSSFKVATFSGGSPASVFSFRMKKESLSEFTYQWYSRVEENSYKEHYRLKIQFLHKLEYYNPSATGSQRDRALALSKHLQSAAHVEVLHPPLRITEQASDIWHRDGGSQEAIRAVDDILYEMKEALTRPQEIHFDLSRTTIFDLVNEKIRDRSSNSIPVGGYLNPHYSEKMARTQEPLNIVSSHFGCMDAIIRRIKAYDKNNY